MLPIWQYEEKFSISRGTVQNAIKFLLDKMCMTIEKRGPKGSYITSLSYGRLWEYADWGTLTGTMPVPRTILQKGLTTAIFRAMQKNPAPFNFAFVMAANNRLKALTNNRYDFIITSKLAMDLSKDTYPRLEVGIELNNCIYSEPYVLFHHEDKFKGVRDGMKIAVNKNSIEQVYLSELICKGKNVEILEMPYADSYKAFIRKQVDLIVSRFESEFVTKYNIKYESLSNLNCDVDCMIPVIVVNKDNYGIAEFIRNIIDIKAISNIQKQVIAGEIDPSIY